MADDPSAAPGSHRRRPRYSGKYPRRFEEKYKELAPKLHGDTVARVLASGKTPAGTHRPVMVREVLEALAPRPGEIAVDATLGHGGHALEILPRLLPGGFLIGLDADPLELPRTEMRLRGLGFGPDVFAARRSNFAGLPQALAAAGAAQPGLSASEQQMLRADLILADLGASSMQLDDPARGFSMKLNGPLDMRMNPRRGEPASALISRHNPESLAALLAENADEPDAPLLGRALSGKKFTTTLDLARAVRAALPRLAKDAADLAVRRVFQALRIAVNDEFSALETFLRHLPSCLNPGGRAGVLTFHSGEDRRVKAAFAAGFREGLYSGIAREVIRPGAEERRSNPRSAPAKLRWARRAT